MRRGDSIGGPNVDRPPPRDQKSERTDATRSSSSPWVTADSGERQEARRRPRNRRLRRLAAGRTPEGSTASADYTTDPRRPPHRTAPSIRMVSTPLMSDIREIPLTERDRLAPLLNLHSPADATAAYYALDHPAERVRLFVEYAGSGAPRGFLALAQTGLDLFRRLAVPFAAHPMGLANLLQAALAPGVPAMILLPLEQQKWVDGWVDLTEVRVTDLYRLHTSLFQPVLNVLVSASESPSGGARFEIRSPVGGAAAAGTNWAGANYAEVYVETDRDGRARGFSRSVLAAIAGQMLSDRRIALYRIDEMDAPAQAEAAEVGFRRTGDRVLLAQAVLRRTEGDAGE